MSRRLLGVVTLGALLASLLVVGSANVPRAAAQQYDPQSIRYQTNARGDIDFIGNTLLTCRTTANNCTGGQNGTAVVANNDFSMIQVDQAGLGTNSSSSTLTLPPSANVVFAGLYWGAVSSSGARNQASFRAPGGGFQTVTAATVDSDGGQNYQAFYDATAEVQAAGSGEYTVGNVATRTGRGRFAGWSMLVVYEDTSLPFRNLTVYDGYARVNSSNPVSIDLTGFLTPVTGPVTAKVTNVVYEGDNRFTGDFMEFEGTRLGDGAHPAGNFFNSRISKDGVLFNDKDPNYVDQLGFDIARTDVTGLLANNQTSATIDYGSRGDWYYVGVVGSAIDIFVPDLDTDLVKVATDLNGGDVVPGDIIEYSISSENLGQDPAINAVLTDPIPTGTTYVAESMQYIDHPVFGGTNPTDSAADADGASFVGGPTFDIGRIDIGETFEVKFRVEVQPGTEFTTIENDAALDYTGETLPGTIYTNTGSTTFDVEAAADLVFESKVDSVDPVTAGTNFDYTLTVRNDGPSTSVAPVITDAIPAGLTFVSGAGCVAGPPVSCTLADIAPAANGSVTITVTADASAPATTLNNTASVASPTTTDPDTSNNSASETTEIVRNTDVLITKSDAADPVLAGTDVTYTVTVANAGPSTATDTIVSEALPAGVTLVSALPDNGTTCVGTGLLSCDLGTLAPAETVVITVVVTTDFDLIDATALSNTASVTTTSPETDATPGNNSATEPTTVNRQAALDLTKTGPASVNAGELVSYTITATNNGPSISQNAVITDVLPPGFVFDAATSTPGCTPADCPIGDLGVGAANAVSVTISARVPSSAVATAATTNSASVIDDDANTATNSHDVEVTREVDLNIAKSGSIDPVAAGAPLTYTLVATNAGPSDAANASIVDDLPAGLTATSSSFTPAGDGLCAGTTTITCTPTAGVLAAGQTVTVIIVVDIPANLPAGSTLSNTAMVVADEDPVGSSSSIDTKSFNDVNLTIGKVVTPSPVIAGENVTYTITFNNAGLSDAVNPSIVDALPADVAYVSAEFSNPADGTCLHDGLASGGDITCTPATLLNGQTVTVTVVGTVDPSVAAGTDLTNNVTGTADNPAGGTFSADGEAIVNVQRAADLAVAKSAAPDPVVAGENVTYTIDITNNGPSDSSGIVALDPLPTGVTPVIPLPTGCVDNSGTINCDVGVLAAGQTTSINLITAIDASTDPGIDLYPNTVTVTANEPDPNDTNDANTVGVDVQTVVDLTIAKVDNVDPVIAGETVIYSIEVGNDGSSDADLVEMTDTPPAGLTFDAAASTSGCTFVDPTIVCQVGTLQPTETATVNLAFTVNSDATPGTVTNSATVTSEEDTTGVSASQETTIETRADLAVLKTATPDPVVAGEDLTFTIEVENKGPSSAVGATLADTLPANLTFVSVTPATCTGSAASQDVNCAFGDLAADATVTVTIVATVDAATTTNVDNTTTVASTTSDPNLGNNSSLSSTAVLPQADISVTKADSVDPVIAGTGLSYTITAANAGPSTATNVVVADVLPPQVAFVSAPGCSHTGETFGGTVTCTVASIAAGASVPIVITTTVDSTTTAVLASNNVTIDADTDDPLPSDNAASETTAIQAVADLSLSKVASPNPVLAGEQVTYTLVISNAGPSAAQAVNVTDQLPPGMSFVSSTVLNGPATCTGAPGAGGTVGCGYGVIEAGGSRMVEIVVDVLASATGTQTNNAAATSPTDPNPPTATAPVTVNTAADLVMTQKTDNVDPAIAGQPLIWTLAIRNDGPSDAVDSTITDTLPAGVSYDDANSTAACEVASGVVTCPTGTLAPGETATVEIAVIIDAATTGTIENTGASTQSTTTDPTPGNNSQTESTTVETQSQVTAIKTSSPDPVVAGQNLTYEIVVNNGGPSNAVDVVLTDPLPAGTSLVSATSTPAGTCTEPSSGLVNCELGTLGVDAPVTVTIEVATDASLADNSSLLNTATVNFLNGDPVTAPNNNAVSREADLSIEKADVEDIVAAGADIVWALTIENNGPSDASNVVVTDTLPPNTTFNAALSSSECQVIGADVVCNLAAIPLGGTAQLALAATVDPGVAPGTVVTNSVSISADETDPLPGNNTATEDTTIAQLNDLSIVKTDNPDPVVAGEEISWTITVINDGPSNASGVQVEDTLPGNVTFVGFTPVPPSGSDPACAAVGQLVTCAVSDIAAGDAVDVTIIGTVDSAAAAGSIVTNAAEISAFDGTDPDLNNNADNEPTSVERQAGIVLTKTASPAPVVAGENITFTLRLQNDGPSDASGVLLSDVLPVGLAFVEVTVLATGQDATCAESSGTITCTPDATGDSIAAGDFIEVQVVATTASSLAAGDSIANTASAAANELPVGSPVEGQSITPASRIADLALAKSATDAVLAGEQVTYTLTVTNNGPSNASGIVVDDILPQGITFASGAGCTANGPAVKCEQAAAAELAPGSTLAFTFIADVADDFADGTSITNGAIVSGTEIDPVDTNDEASASTDVAREADLTITKSDGGVSVVAGQTVTYAIEVTNTGPSQASGLQVFDNVPPNTSFDQGGSTSSCNESGGTVTCDLAATLDVGETATVVVAFVVDDDLATGSTVSNTATVSANETDPTPANEATDTTPTLTDAAVSIVKDAVDTMAVAGTNLTWALEVSNAGPSVARNVVVSDTLPAGLTGVSATPNECTVTDTTLTCTFPVVEVGETIGITLVTLVAADQTDPVINTASVTTDTTPGTTVTPPVEVPVGLVADLAVSKTSAPDPIVPGQPITYTLVVTNNGPSAVVGARVADTTPVEAVEPSSTCAVDPADGTCTDTSIFPETSYLVDLAPGTSATVTIDATVDPAAVTGFLNTATVAAPPGVTDPVPENNENDDGNIADPTVITDLAITKTSSPNPAVAGEAITYTMIVTNNGPSTAAGAAIADQIPPAIVNPSATCVVDPDDGACAVTTAGSDLTGMITLDPGASLTITVAGSVDPATTTEIANTATVSPSPLATDPDRGNNTAVDRNTPTVSADLFVTKRADNGSGVAGTTTTWTVTVGNNGPSTATGVSVRDLLPPTLTLVGEPANCTAGVCDVGVLAPGATVDLQFETLIGAAVTTPIVNSAEVTSAVPDPVPDNNRTDSPALPIDVVTDLAVVKSSAPDPVVAGVDVTYTIVVTNNGPSDSVGATVTDSVPAAVLNPIASCSVVPSAGSCAVTVQGADSEATVSLPVGESAVIVIEGTVDNAFDGSIENTVVVAPGPGSTDPSPTNNNDVNVNPSTGAANLSITKTSSPSSAVPGETITYTLVVGNAGPSRVVGATVLDLLPAALSGASVTCSAVLPNACDADVVGQEVVGTATISPATTVTLIVTAVLDPSFTGDLTNTATTNPPPAVTDPQPADNTATDINTVAPAADLAITKTPGAADALADGELLWTITVNNNGPSTATDVVVTDLLPAELTLVAEPTNCSSLVCTVDQLNPGEQVSFRFTTRVIGNGATTIVNAAMVTASTPDPQPGNNAVDSPAVPVTAVTDLSISKTSAPSPVVAGGPITYTLVITNDGPSDAIGATVSDDLASEITSASARCVAVPALGACNAAVVGSSLDATVDIPVGESLTIAIDATISPDYDGSVENFATVAPGPGAVDLQVSDNLAIDLNPSTGVADLSILKTIDNERPKLNQPVVWSLLVTNDGPSTVIGATITDVVPGGIADVTWTCAVPQGVAACGDSSGSGDVNVLVDLTVGSTVEVVITARVTRVQFDLTNTASVASPPGFTDPDLTNNQSTVVAFSLAPPPLPVRGSDAGFEPTVLVPEPAVASVPALVPDSRPLAVTGSDSRHLTRISLLLIVAGASTVLGANRRRRRHGYR